jgi:group I intron endonuclease
LVVSGVYQIVNTVNGKRYIGSAVDLVKRWKEHLSLLRHRKHPNTHLQAAVGKYGEVVFEFKILLVCDNVDCVWYEQKALDVYAPEYNIAKNAVAPMLGRAGDKNPMFGRTGEQCPAFGRTGEKHPMFGKQRLDVAERVGEKNPMFGKHHTNESIEKMRVAKCGKNNPMFGKPNPTLSERNRLRGQKTCRA